MSRQSVTAPTRFAEALEYIRSGPRRQAGYELVGALATAAQDGWAGDGSQKVAFLTYKNARDLLAALPRHFPPPDITAGVDGRIEFDWFVSPDNSLTVSVGPADGLPWAALEGSSRKKGVAEFASDFPGDLQDVLSRLYDDR